MRLLSGNSEPKRALCDDHASFWTILNRAATKVGCYTNTAAVAAEPNARASKLNEMAHNDKHAGISEYQFVERP